MRTIFSNACTTLTQAFSNFGTKSNNIKGPILSILSPNNHPVKPIIVPQHVPIECGWEVIEEKDCALPVVKDSPHLKQKKAVDSVHSNFSTEVTHVRPETIARIKRIEQMIAAGKKAPFSQETSIQKTTYNNYSDFFNNANPYEAMRVKTNEPEFFRTLYADKEDFLANAGLKNALIVDFNSLSNKSKPVSTGGPAAKSKPVSTGPAAQQCRDPKLNAIRINKNLKEGNAPFASYKELLGITTNSRRDTTLMDDPYLA